MEFQCFVRVPRESEKKFPIRFRLIRRFFSRSLLHSRFGNNIFAAWLEISDIIKPPHVHIPTWIHSQFSFFSPPFLGVEAARKVKKSLVLSKKLTSCKSITTVGRGWLPGRRRLVQVNHKLVKRVTKWESAQVSRRERGHKKGNKRKVVWIIQNKTKVIHIHQKTSEKTKCV